MTQRQLEMMKDLHLGTKHGHIGLSIPKSQRRFYLKLEHEGLVYFLLHAGRECSIRLTDKGQKWAANQFAYAYKNQPRQGQTTYQDVSGKVVLVVDGVAP